MYLIVAFFPSGNDVRVGGEYPLIRVFINVFSSGVTGFHREEIITKASTRWSNRLDQFILKTKFALCLAINETPALINLGFTFQLYLRIIAKCNMHNRSKSIIIIIIIVLWS